MSKDTIYRDDAIGALDNAWINGTSLLDANEAVKQLSDLPSADRPQGEWLDVWQDGICSWRGTCSVCRSTNDIPPPFEANFCPSCGARMKGADDE